MNSFLRSTEKYANPPQHHPNSFHPTWPLPRFAFLKKNIPKGMATVAVAAASCSLWSEVGFVGFFWGGAGRNSPLVVELKPTKKRVAYFFATKRQGGWVVFPSPDCNRDRLIFHFFFWPGKGFALKLFFDFFCDRATQQAPYFCDL